VEDMNFVKSTASQRFNQGFQNCLLGFVSILWEIHRDYTRTEWENQRDATSSEQFNI